MRRNVLKQGWKYRQNDWSDDRDDAKRGEVSKNYKYNRCYANEYGRRANYY